MLASGALKNHFGTLRFGDGHLIPEYLHPPIIHNSIADINSNRQLVEKTRLIVMDALFGRHSKKGGAPEKWMIFNKNSPNRLFFSKDSVAIDSVTSSLVKEELNLSGEKPLSDEYLRLSQEAGVGNFTSIVFIEIEA